jgi:hypothetical protein
LEEVRIAVGHGGKTLLLRGVGLGCRSAWSAACRLVAGSASYSRQIFGGAWTGPVYVPHT